ncbi:hypothetical protein [Methylocapsa acidiphila]|uniref:hypothetical protein n=1 Tax=Methylocapsa acidiphila TaxID=133552 RepID=UPI000428BDA5|nr:hypothetical protein [Methylocapsa acidiphila]
MSPCYFLFCVMLAPGPAMVPDGGGGYVPITNSRVMPDGSLRSYDPLFDDGYDGYAAAYPAYPVYPQPRAIRVEPAYAPGVGYWLTPVPVW